MAIYNPGQHVAFEEREISQQSFLVQVEGIDARQNNDLAWRRIQGVVTLEEACIRLVLSQIHDLTSKALENVPWNLAQKIWRRIQPMSFEIWRMFVQIFGHEDNYPDASLSLPGFTFSLPPGMENGTAWLTILTLQPDLISFEDLVNLSLIKSLTVLTLNSAAVIRTSRSMNVDDRLIRTWSRSAQEAGTFSNLRVISFYHCQYLTTRCLRFLNEMSALAWISFHDCHSFNSRDIQSWESITKMEKEWFIIDLRSKRDSSSKKESTIKLHEIPESEYSAWLEWYKGADKLLIKSKSLLDRLPRLANTDQDNKPMLSASYGRQPVALGCPLAFRRIPSNCDVLHDPIPPTIQKQPSEEQALKTSKRQMKGGKVQDTDFSQFF